MSRSRLKLQMRSSGHHGALSPCDIKVEGKRSSQSLGEIEIQTEGEEVCPWSFIQ